MGTLVPLLSTSGCSWLKDRYTHWIRMISFLILIKIIVFILQIDYISIKLMSHRYSSQYT